MATRSFIEFLDEKKRQSRSQLKVIKDVLQNNGFRIESHLDEQFADPYVYCYNPDKDTSFKGIRIYKIGDQLAYRVQRESKTHPFGTAYLLDLDGIFNDLMSDGVVKKDELGKKVMEEIVKNLRAFFKESAKAEKEEDKWSDGEDAENTLGMVHVRNPLGGDYSSYVHDG